MEILGVLGLLLEVILGSGKLAVDLNLYETQGSEGFMDVFDHCISIETDVCQSTYIMSQAVVVTEEVVDYVEDIIVSFDYFFGDPKQALKTESINVAIETRTGDELAFFRRDNETLEFKLLFPNRENLKVTYQGTDLLIAGNTETFQHEKLTITN